jgi:hypothetical protein
VLPSPPLHFVEGREIGARTQSLGQRKCSAPQRSLSAQPGSRLRKGSHRVQLNQTIIFFAPHAGEKGSDGTPSRRFRGPAIAQERMFAVEARFTVCAAKEEPGQTHQNATCMNRKEHKDRKELFTPDRQPLTPSLSSLRSLWLISARPPADNPQTAPSRRCGQECPRLLQHRAPALSGRADFDAFALAFASFRPSRNGSDFSCAWIAPLFHI